MLEQNATINAMLTTWASRIMSSSASSAIDASFSVSCTDQKVYWVFRCGKKVSVDTVEKLGEDMHCRISFDARAGTALYKGDQTLQQAMLTGGIAIEGEVAKALSFFSITCPGGKCD